MNGALALSAADARGLLAEHVGFVRDHRARLAFPSSGYARTLVHAADAYEIVAMLWAPGARTPVHDHGTSRCSALLLEGSLYVERFVAENGVAKPVGTFRYEPGDLEQLDDARSLHRVQNQTHAHCVSLHLYAQPLRTYRVYDLRSRRVETHISHYDASVFVAAGL